MIEGMIERLNLETTIPDPEAPRHVREYVRKPVARVEIPPDGLDWDRDWWRWPCPAHFPDPGMLDEAMPEPTRVWIVDLWPARWAYTGGPRTAIFMGQCEECKTIYYSIRDEPRKTPP